MYKLEYDAYQAPNYPRDRLREQVHRRGRELTSAMVAAYPEMILWILPDAVWSYGPLAADLFTGFVDALAESHAPGGIHMCPELYTVTSPRELLVQT